MESNFILVKSGNQQNSINNIVNKVAKVLEENEECVVKAFGNNMNKLVSVVEIIKNELGEIENKYSIGKENDIEYIQCRIKASNINKEKLKGLIKEKAKKRREKSKKLEDSKEENNEEKVIITNIKNFFI